LVRVIDDPDQLRRIIRRFSLSRTAGRSACPRRCAEVHGACCGGAFAAALAEAAPVEGRWEAGEKRVFGACAPAVGECRKLCCGSLIGGILNSNSGR
jgi:hypothetical protein